MDPFASYRERALGQAGRRWWENVTATYDFSMVRIRGASSLLFFVFLWCPAASRKSSSTLIQHCRHRVSLLRHKLVLAPSFHLQRAHSRDLSRRPVMGRSILESRRPCGFIAPTTPAAYLTPPTTRELLCSRCEDRSPAHFIATEKPPTPTPSSALPSSPAPSSPFYPTHNDLALLAY
ncbi:hypothetical protein C8F01DRAFT_205542 [Mycena amicta]|nr:hypothetical protein C8F01DRAFT_205542 [Mycena amicta]